MSQTAPRMGVVECFLMQRGLEVAQWLRCKAERNGLPRGGPP